MSAIVDDEASARIHVWMDDRNRKCWEPVTSSSGRRIPARAEIYVPAIEAEEDVEAYRNRVEELEGILRTMMLELKACYDILSTDKEDREVLDAAKEALDGKLKKRKRETARERRIRLRGW